jgi:hypothetical protein
MKPFIHARSSAAKFGGTPSDYIKIHEYFDSTKSSHADVRHRAILHTAFGIYLVADVFGHHITNSDGKTVSVRDIGEQHVMEDLGRIPSMSDYLNHMTIEDWMLGPHNKAKRNITKFSMAGTDEGDSHVFCRV